MKTLSGLDASFLYLETAQTPMHVGSFHLYELAPGFKGSFHKAVQDHVGRRLHLAPIFSRKLVSMPISMGHPIWADAPYVDMDFHIRRVKLPSGATVGDAQALCAQLHGQLIDRSRPLWEFHVFDRLRSGDGKRVAGFYSKIHHAALDGKGGTVLANAILDLSAVPRQVPPPDPARKAPSRGELKIGQMVGAVFSNTLAQYAKLARALPGALSSVAGMLASRAMDATAGKDDPKTGRKLPISLAPRTRFNVPITPGRIFATASVPFGECKGMARAVGGTFNDIVLWICSSALRDYLLLHDALPKKPLLAAMPVSLRDENNKEMNNQASMSVVDLGTHLAHPIKRMNAIMASTAKVKSALVNLKSVLPTDYPSFLAPWVVGGVARAAFKTYSAAGVAERLPMIANLAISNVPGPQVPLYLAGARMLSFHPLSIVMHGLALNITVQTYAGSVDFGLVADKKAVPDLQLIADALVGAFKEAQRLFAAARPADNRAAVKAAIRTKAEPSPAKPASKRPRAKSAH